MTKKQQSHLLIGHEGDPSLRLDMLDFEEEEEYLAVQCILGLGSFASFSGSFGSNKWLNTNLKISLTNSLAHSSVWHWLLAVTGDQRKGHEWPAFCDPFSIRFSFLN